MKLQLLLLLFLVLPFVAAVDYTQQDYVLSLHANKIGAGYKLTLDAITVSPSAQWPRLNNSRLSSRHLQLPQMSFGTRRWVRIGTS